MKPKSRKRKEEQADLIVETPQPWIVRACLWTKKDGKELEGTINYGGQHRLCYKGRCIERARGHQNLKRLQAVADLLNATNAEPRAKIECAADAPNPEKWLHDNRYITPTKSS